MFFRMLVLVAIMASNLASAMQPAPLFALIEEKALASQAYGSKHPRVVLLNQEIERRLNGGERLDPEAIEQRLLDLVAERSGIRRRYGARHPKTIDNAKRIQAISGMLVSAE